MAARIDALEDFSNKEILDEAENRGLMPEEIVISDFSDEELRDEVTRRGMESEALEPRASELLEAIAGAHEGRAGAATEAMSILIDIVPSIASERGAALDLARLRPEGYWNAGQGR